MAGQRLSVPQQCGSRARPAAAACACRRTHSTAFSLTCTRVRPLDTRAASTAGGWRGRPTGPRQPGPARTPEPGKSLLQASSVLQRREDRLLLACVHRPSAAAATDITHSWHFRRGDHQLASSAFIGPGCSAALVGGHTLQPHLRHEAQRRTIRCCQQEHHPSQPATQLSSTSRAHQCEHALQTAGASGHGGAAERLRKDVVREPQVSGWGWGTAGAGCGSSSVRMGPADGALEARHASRALQRRRTAR